ncbi:MAG TPA: hypothetical protein DDW50_10020, partial [Firmicutes bacterium]|nr:hypothetical protein [Bacillota bacterium]
PSHGSILRTTGKIDPFIGKILPRHGSILSTTGKIDPFIKDILKKDDTTADTEVTETIRCKKSTCCLEA